ncbi:MAG: NUDIX hydrolase, partial [Candidatus Sungbacteria bacterium]|nr:NUDIX hydrolase [Candidatus Sungbacteria bacterium]
NSEIILVKEFRSPARTPDGFIHELPGGSSVKKDIPAIDVANEEIFEETGFHVEPSRLRYVGSRQLAGTLSSHHGHLYELRLTDLECARFKERAKMNEALGVADDSEKTYVEVRRLSEILAGQLVDWSTLGMILQVISQ